MQLSSMLPPLFRMAIKAGSLETVKSALEQGLDPNFQDTDGNSLLLYALKAKQFQICQLLIARGANPEPKSNKGISVLDLAEKFDESNALQSRISQEAFCNSNNEKQCATDDWITEEAPSLPESDHHIADEANKRQFRINNWAAIDNDDNWDEIEISLPSQISLDRLERPLVQAISSLANMAEQYGVIDPLKISEAILSLPIDEDVVDETLVKIEYILASRGFAIENCIYDGYSWDDPAPQYADFDSDFFDFTETILSKKMTSLSLFLKSLSKTQALSREEEKVYFEQLAKDPSNPMVREKIILSNLRFAYKTGASFSRDSKGVGAEDRISEAIIGLIKSVDRFDINLDYRFITYAVHWIRQRVQKTIHDNEQNIRIPPNKIFMLNRFRKNLDKLGGDIDKTLALDEFKDQPHEITKLFEISEELSLEYLILEAQENNRYPPFDLSCAESANQESEFKSQELKTAINRVLNELLTEREAKILRMYYGLDCDKDFTFDEIGRELRLTRERVRQIKNKSLNRLLKNKESREALMTFYGESIY